MAAGEEAVHGTEATPRKGTTITELCSNSSSPCRRILRQLPPCRRPRPRWPPLLPRCLLVTRPITSPRRLWQPPFRWRPRRPQPPGLRLYRRAPRSAPKTRAVTSAAPIWQLLTRRRLSLLPLVPLSIRLHPARLCLSPSPLRTHPHWVRDLRLSPHTLLSLSKAYLPPLRQCRSRRRLPWLRQMRRPLAAARLGLKVTTSLHRSRSSIPVCRERRRQARWVRQRLCHRHRALALALTMQLANRRDPQHR